MGFVTNLCSSQRRVSANAPALFVGLGLNVGWRRVEQQAGVRLAEADSGVGAYNLTQMREETPPEVPRPSVVGAKLTLKSLLS